MTPPALVDTSILIDHLRGVHAARDLLADAVAQRRPLIGSVLTRVEVLAGMRTKEEAETPSTAGRAALGSRRCCTRRSCRRLASRYVRSHPGIDTVDYVIAATMSAEHADLWTLNVKHFPMLLACARLTKLGSG